MYFFCYLFFTCTRSAVVKCLAGVRISGAMVAQSGNRKTQVRFLPYPQARVRKRL